MRQRMWQAITGLTVVLAFMVGSASAANAAQTCAQLQSKLTLLWNLYNHATGEAAKQRLLDQIDAVDGQMEAQGCYDSVTRTLSTAVRIWTDSDRAPGPYDTNITFQVRINNLGDVSWSLPTITFSNGITISQNGSSTSGHYASSGYLALTAPIRVQTNDGDATGTLDISTDQTVSTREGIRTGSRVSSPASTNGSVTMVGNTPLTISVLQLNAQIQMSGTLS